ncbi:hypothetical protein Tco_0415276, partial [Tanacetum coccineum]
SGYHKKAEKNSAHLYRAQMEHEWKDVQKFMAKVKMPKSEIIRKKSCSQRERN